ncbi:hypothetical protein SPRG_07009 [Saprolegnia parasitica CBS 223.65]|uniref:Elicitin n=1 Tax=Saprolegnia parasitica (strain CBS 223.65) TaxID=695850 RepID=A0A067CLJ5_SAPPC|nr:hypothetical protein SPRG_07009 [Saprolegnia parasitica CBS 223.65]KDO27421.1 hypothetical protein SPRG_07009 [Saprolegnia parasitica CBS 223.65]|eukprot:XP_012201861.1 hypothetical protein SPRG_07009 [Saprolegnia parasitica CBS 223.65]
MKFTVLATLAACAMAAETTTTTTAPPKVSIDCTQAQIATINALQATETYMACTNDAQKTIFNGTPDDICAVPSCVVAVQNLVGKFPSCVFDKKTPINDIKPFIKTCGVDPNLIVTTAPAKSTRPTATLANATDANATTVPIVTVAEITTAPRTKVAAATPTPAPSAAVANSASLLAIGSAALAYALA